MDGLERLLDALRRRADEAQLTQALAAFGSSDARFASRIVEVLLGQAPEQERATSLTPVPSELVCSAENRLEYPPGSGKGFVDLRFDGPSQDFSLLVELKLFSGYGESQLERYLDGLKALPARRSGLIAVTRDSPTYDENAISDDDRWLGSVRWGRLFEGLRGLEHADPSLRAAWRALLDILRRDGDFGTMTLDAEAAKAWSQATEGRDALIGVLNEIASAALDIVRDELAAHGNQRSDSTLADLNQHKNRVVWPWKDRINIQISIPPGSGERLRIQFLGGTADGPYFTVEARHTDARQRLSEADDTVTLATGRLIQQHFKVGRDWENYWAKVHQPEEWLYTGSGLHEKLLEMVRVDVRALVQSGIFDALAEGQTGPSSPPPRSIQEDPASGGGEPHEEGDSPR